MQQQQQQRWAQQRLCEPVSDPVLHAFLLSSKYPQQVGTVTICGLQIERGGSGGFDGLSTGVRLEQLSQR